MLRETETEPLRRNLFLFRELVKRDFRGRYAGSLLGFFWSFAQPLWLLLLFGFVFSTVMKVQPLGTRTDRFAVFLFCGLLPWMAVQEGVLRAASAITDNASLVKKLRFPSEVLVAAVVAAALLHEGIAAAIFWVALLVLGEGSWQSLPWLLVAIPLQVLLTVGLGFCVSSAHVFFRDTSQVLGMGLTAWFYVTPIVYPLEFVPERLRGWIELNPLTGLVDLYRRAFLGAAGPLPWRGLASLVLISLAFAMFGAWLFGRLKPAFVDQV